MPEIDEHGCIVGQELWDEEKGECVPIPKEKPTDVFVPLGSRKVRRRR